MKPSISQLRWYLLPFALFLLFTPAQAAILTGDTVTCGTDGFALLTCGPDLAIVGAGPEFDVTKNGNPFLSVDFGSSDLLFTALVTTSVQANANVSFTDITNPFTSASFISSSNASIDAGNLIFRAEGGTVILALNFVELNAGDTVRIGLNTASAVPEPGTVGFIAPMLLGLIWMYSRTRE